MTPEEWRSAGEYFRWEGHSIFYRAQGGGDRALLLIHGFPTASWDFDRLWPALSQRYDHVVTLDMLGFGFSDKPREHVYSMVEQADVHEALLEKRGIRHVDILAHDYGVSVAQELLARDFERQVKPYSIGSVTLLNGGLFPETHRMTGTQRLLRSPLGPLVTKLMNERLFSKSFSVVFGPQTKPNAAELHDFWSLVQYNKGADVMHLLIAYISERRFNRLINGPEDPVSGAHMVQRYRELINNPDVVSLPGIGHYPQTEAPEQVLQAFFEFQDQLKRA
jgi:pimeloyl-ACP methyl ester carboxylesterase